MNYLRRVCTPEQSVAVPGVSYDTINQRAQGPADAIAVICKRQGATPPPLPEVAALTSGGVLRQYQDEGVSWLTHMLMTEGAAILADDMGLGKTTQLLHTWEACDNPKLFVACPGKVRETWRRQFKKWMDYDAYVIDAGTQWDDPKAAQAQVIITSYELSKQVPDWYYPQMVVIDEAHNIRGRGAARSRSLLDTMKAAPMRVALTGTPMWSRPRDLWMPLRTLFGYRFGNADEFDIAYCGANWNRYGGKENKGATRSDELQLRLSYVMKRRLKREVAKELPPVIREVHWVPGTKRAKEKLRQSLVTGSDFHGALEATLDDKLKVAVETAADFGTNVIMFTWMKKHAMELQVMMEDAGMKTYLITGDVSHKQRDVLIERATKEKASLVCTIDSVSEGVDGLQFVTSNCVFHALDHLPIKVAQTISRLDRLGQKEPVTAIFIAMKDTADQLVAHTVIDKLEQWLKIFGVDDNTKLKDAFTQSKTTEREMEQLVLKQMYEEMSP